MEITSPDFEKIIMFQEVESIIREENEKLRNLTREIDALEENFSVEKEKFKSLEEEYRKMLLEKKSMENELYQTEEAINKHQIELNQVKKNEEFKALLLEIENLKTKKDDMENGILDLIETLEKKSKIIAGSKNSLLEMEKNKNEEIAKKKAEMEKIKIYAQEMAERERSIKEEISDESLKKRIDNLMKNKNGIAVVNVNIKRNETIKSSPEECFCSGCNMKLTSSDVSSVKKLNTFIICQNCSRLVYYRG